MQKPTEIAKQIADLLRGDQIAALQVREYLTAADLVDLLGLHDYVKENSFAEDLEIAEAQIEELSAENRRLERLLNGKAQD